MNAKHLVSIGLAAMLWLSSPATLSAQSNWPNAPKPVAAAGPAAPEKSQKAAPKAKRRSARRSPTTRVDNATLRTISDLLARQTLAIEALTLRLEAAERRRDEARLPVPDLTTDLTNAVTDHIPNACRRPHPADWMQALEEQTR